jgi:hypothetical protein
VAGLCADVRYINPTLLGCMDGEFFTMRCPITLETFSPSSGQRSAQAATARHERTLHRDFGRIVERGGVAVVVGRCERFLVTSIVTPRYCLWKPPR